MGSTVAGADYYEIEIRKKPKNDPKKQINPVVPISKGFPLPKIQKLAPIVPSKTISPLVKPISASNPPWKLCAMIPVKKMEKSNKQLFADNQKTYTIETFLENRNDPSTVIPISKATCYEFRIRAH